MPTFDIVKEIESEESFRVASVMGKFDLQSNHIKEQFQGNIEFENKEWQIGIIVGPSGTGKTTIAKELFPNAYIYNYEYKSKSILDDFPKDLSVEEITRTFNSVGFSSPPSWLKPYNVLSNGEKMRVDLARAILTEKELIVFDEFTSVVDRNVAKIGSAALSKAIKRTNKNFIAVSCHYDIIEWLEPDWVYDTKEMKFDYIRGELRRPEIKLEIREQKGMWNIFRKYHYLNYDIHKASRQFIAFYNNEPIALCATLIFPHPTTNKFRKCTRLVVLPDYQGLGIGSKLLKFVAQYFVNNGFRFLIVTSTPALIQSFRNSTQWKLKYKGRIIRSKVGSIQVNKLFYSCKRFTTSWEFVLADK